MFTASWNDSQSISFVLWDIDREFQNSHEAYEQWLAKTRRKKSTWKCIARSNNEDPLEKSLSLGGHVMKAIKEGKEAFGSTFEKGDCTYYRCRIFPI